jgi:hypothetical protein
VKLAAQAGVSISCHSLSTTAVGCTILKGNVSFVARYNLTGKHPFVTKAGTTYPYPSVVVTPKVTAWYTCSNKGCPLYRVPVAGKKLTTYPMPIVANVVSVGDLLYFSPSNNTTSSGGLFSMLDTAGVPTHIVSGTHSPLDTSSIAVGTTSIAWIDNGHSGLGVWTRSLRVSGSKVVLGKPKLLGGDGFLDTDATAYSLNIADSGNVVASTSYAKQPTADPLDVSVFDGGHTSVISDAGDWAAFGGPIIDISATDVLYQTLTGFDLETIASKKVTVLPMTDIARYAAGGGKVAFIKTDGSVWVETNSRKGLTQLAPPLPGGSSFSYVSSLSVSSNGSYVAWAYSWYSTASSGQAAQWVSTKPGSTPQTIPAKTGLVATVSITPTVLGVGYAQPDGSSQLWAANVPTGTWKEYAPVVYGLSIGGNVAGWIGANGLPYLLHI